MQQGRPERWDALFYGARGRAHLRNHFQVLLDVLPPVDDATAGERLFNSGITYNVCPSSDNETRDEIKDRKRGFRDGRCTLRNRNRKISGEEIECVQSIQTPSAAHSVPLDGIEKFVGPLAAPRENSTAE